MGSLVVLDRFLIVVIVFLFMVRNNGLFLINMLLVIYMLSWFISVYVMNGLFMTLYILITVIMLIVMRFSSIVMRVVIHLNPLLTFARSLLDMVGVFSAIPECIVVLGLLLVMDTVLNWMMHVMLILALVMCLVGWVQVQMSLI